MTNAQSKHRAIDSTYHERIENLLYSRTDEKKVAADLLAKIFANRRYKHFLGVGAGPGEITKPLADISEKLTIIELVSEYEETLRSKFPNATIVIDSIDNISLKNEYDLILLSQVLYYFPQAEWVGLVEKLYDALMDGGELVLILMDTSGDWWKTVNNYWARLREHIRFDYIPLPQFKTELMKFGIVMEFPFRSRIIFDSESALVECMGREILQISEERILREYHNDFAKFASNFKREGNKIILQSNCDILMIKKPHGKT